VVLAYVGRQLEIEDPSCVARYLERRRTRFEHAEEIKVSEGLRDFAALAGEFEEWIAARAYMTGDGPYAIFADATSWLRGQQVLLPGVTTLARLVARARSDGEGRLWETLAGFPTGPERVALDALLDVAQGARTSELERARRGPADPTGTSLKLALHRVRDIHGVGVDGERARALVPARRLAELARYGLAAKAPRLRRHPPARRIATLVATVCQRRPRTPSPASAGAAMFNRVDHVHDVIDGGFSARIGASLPPWARLAPVERRVTRTFTAHPARYSSSGPVCLYSGCCPKT
jgi:hypothetical protein